jgi:hypothetical protein
MTEQLSNSNILSIVEALILLVVVLSLWGGHFFPWHIIPVLVDPTGKRELKRMVSYTYGVGCVWLGAVAFALTRQSVGLEATITIPDLTVIIIAAALGTALPRLVKRIRDIQVTLSELQS